MRLEQLGDEATRSCSSLAARGQRDTEMLQRIWADLERIHWPGCLVEVRRRSWWTGSAEAVVVIATFISHEAYVSMCTKLELSSERSKVFGRTVHAEQSSYPKP